MMNNKQITKKITRQAKKIHKNIEQIILETINHRKIDRQTDQYTMHITTKTKNGKTYKGNAILFQTTKPLLQTYHITIDEIMIVKYKTIINYTTEENT